MAILHLQMGAVCVLNMILIFYTIGKIQEEKEVISKKRKEYLDDIERTQGKEARCQEENRLIKQNYEVSEKIRDEKKHLQEWRGDSLLDISINNFSDILL